MIQSKMSKHKSWILIGVILLAAIFIWKERQELSLSDVIWVCQGKDCTVTFNIKNKTNNYLPINISMRARIQKFAHDSDALVTRIVGEKILEDELYPNESKQYKELLRVSSKKVSIMNVNAWSH